MFNRQHLTLALCIVVAFMAQIGSGFGSVATIEEMDIAYGPHERNRLDIWTAPGDGPRPLVVFIHGGGWTRGEKSFPSGRRQAFLNNGISVAAINYRLSSDAPLPAPVYDAARAIQYLRSRAEEFNIDPDRIAVTGNSAGGCTSLWLALHEDLADPESEDPIARQSTRVVAAAMGSAQTSIDPKVIEPWFGPQILRHRMIWTSVGAASMAAALENYADHEALYKKFSPINHLTPGDPPLFLTYSHPTDLPATDANHAIHHPEYGFKLKEKADAAGVECHVIVRDLPARARYNSIDEFLTAKLLATDGENGDGQ